MKIRLHPYSLSFLTPWHTAQGVLHSRDGWLVEICTTDGGTGWGDCAPPAWMGSEHTSAADSALQRLQQQLTGLTHQQALQQLDETEVISPAALFAFETALLDLLSQQNSQSLSHLLNPQAARIVEVNAAAGAITKASDAQVMRALNTGMKVLKLKAGVADVNEEVARLSQIAALLPQGARLRIDANQAWSMGDAMCFLLACEKLPVESVEEPVREPDIESWRSLAERSSIPLAADESLLSADCEVLIKSSGIHRVVLKPTMLGGLRRCLELHEMAAAAGVESVVTTTLEGAVGVWACVHLAAAIDARQRFAHGLATSSWFAENTGMPPEIKSGHIRLSGSPGCSNGIPSPFGRG